MDLFDDPMTQPYAAELAREAGVLDMVDGGVHTFRRRANTAFDALAQVRTAWGAARAVRDYPPAHRAALERQVEQAKAAVTAVGAAVTAAADDRARRTAIARTESLNQALARPPGVEQTADRLDLQEARSYLRTLDPVLRAITLKRAAQDGERPELLRAAMSSVEPLVSDRDAREIRERLIARRAPETVREQFAIRQLRKLAADLDLAAAGYAPDSLAKPAPALRDGPHGMKILDE